jgi:hypothetical protein
VCHLCDIRLVFQLLATQLLIAGGMRFIGLTMARNRATKGSTHAFFAWTAACLFLLQALGFGLASNAQDDSAIRGVGASIAQTNVICPSGPNHGEAPSGNHHCLICCLSNHRAVDAGVILTRLVTALMPRSDDAPTWRVTTQLAKSSADSRGSWSARGPPLFS